MRSDWIKETKTGVGEQAGDQHGRAWFQTTQWTDLLQAKNKDQLQ